MIAENSKTTDGQADVNKAWFREMIQNLKLDQTLHDLDVLEKEKKELYDAMITKDHNFMFSYARKTSSNFFITNMAEAYFKELSNVPSKPINIALDLSNSKILVWAEISEDDEKMERALILAEAKINSVFSDYGFHIASTIVEDSDGLEIPEHYQKVAIA